jgi:hypothetical protein
MRKTVGFFAGAAFALGIVVTCGGGRGNPAVDAGRLPTSSDSSDGYEVGVGDVRAQGQPSSGTVYVYAVVNPFGWGIGMPAGVSSPDISSCSTAESEKIACVLNIMGADHWELAGIDAGSPHVQYVFKRAR